MTGHIRSRGDRTWELKFDVGRDALSGKRLTRYHSFKGTKSEAQAELVRCRDRRRLVLEFTDNHVLLLQF